jgi:hypothetical protein
MLSYDAVRQRPDQFLACTGLTVDEFDFLSRSFSRAWEQYRQKNYVNSGGGKPKLPSVLDKLFFILFYYKVYPIQSAMAAIFGMSQSQVCTWITILSTWHRKMSPGTQSSQIKGSARSLRVARFSH